MQTFHTLLYVGVLNTLYSAQAELDGDLYSLSFYVDKAVFRSKLL